MSLRAKSTLPAPRRRRATAIAAAAPRPVAIDGGPGGMPRLEKHEQSDGLKLLRSLGGVTYTSGTARRSTDYQGTNQTPGIPDVEVYLPQPRYALPLPGGQTRLLLKWEVKRPGGRPSTWQREYADLARAAGVHHVLGDLTALMGWLVSAGYLRADQLPHDRQPSVAREAAR